MVRLPMQRLKDKVYELMVKNRRVASGYQYTVPSPETYPYQWLWDSCFHAIILSYFDPEDAKRELLSLITHQFDNGMIPHMIYWDKKSPTDFPVIEWGKEDTSTITQPPMLAYAAFRVYQADKDKEFLKLTYDNLKRYYEYLLKDRDPRGNHLIGIVNPDESGEDNASRFDLTLGLNPRHDRDMNFSKRMELVNKHKACNFETGTCMRNFFWVKDVPFNVITIENLRYLSKIASILKKDGEKTYFREQANLISEAMRKLMWEDGVFWSTYDADYKKIKVVTWAIFIPLFAKLYSEEEAENVINKYLLDEKKFKLPFMVPTVASDDPSFDASGFWRGPIWMNVNWFIYKGLIRYGFNDVAQKIVDSSLSLIEKSGFREQFNPLTGEGLGAKDFTWGGLVLDMVEEEGEESPLPLLPAQSPQTHS